MDSDRERDTGGNRGVPDDDAVPKGSGKQFAEDVADVHEVPTEGPDSGKGFAEGQKHDHPKHDHPKHDDPLREDESKKSDPDS